MIHVKVISEVGVRIFPCAEQHNNKVLLYFIVYWYLFELLMQVNNILSAIKRKKSLDTIILSLVASVCTFLILIYWLTK